MVNKYNFPLFYWHLELASKCALECPRCPRTGPDNKSKYQVTEIPFEKLKNIFSPELLKKEVKKLLLCGGQGDPIYYSKLIEFIGYVKEHNSEIELVLVTNGSYRPVTWWQQLAQVLNSRDHVVFSVDGWDQESNEQYRKGSNFASIMTGLEEILKSTATIHWSTIVFSFNQDKLVDIEKLAFEKGVHYFHRAQSNKFGGAWADQTGVDTLMPRNEFLINQGPYIKTLKDLHGHKDLKDAMETEVKNRKSVFSTEVLTPGCMAGERGLYIDASGIFYPCSWISHPYDMPLKPEQKNIWLTERSRLNIFENGLEKVINDEIWEGLFSSWKSDNKMYATCSEKCSKAHASLYPSLD